MPTLRDRRPSAVCLLVATLAFSSSAPAQWIAQRSPTDAELRGLSVLSPSAVWASGARGTVVHTTDGVTWVQDTVRGAESLDFRAIAATSARVAHVLSIGDSSRIYRTTDGGRTWSLTFTNTRVGAFFDAIQFWDAQHGIAMSDPVDGRFLVITTEDGGETWRELPAERLPRSLPGEAAFAASGTCLMVRGKSDAWLVSGGGATARVHHTPDRGRSWTVVDTPIRAGAGSAGIFSIAFADARNGVIAGGDYQQPTQRGRNLAVTRDGGRTWTLGDSASSPAGYRSAVAYLPRDRRRLVAVGLSGTDISQDGGRSWEQTDSTPYNSVALARAGRSTVWWAVGPKGRIGRWAGERMPGDR